MASYNNTDSIIYIHKKDFDPAIKEEIINLFDAQTSLEIKESLHLKKVCWLKTLVFPLEYPLTLLLLGQKQCRNVITLQKLNWKFIRNKIDINVYFQELSKIR